jgi:hypothetical protein
MWGAFYSPQKESTRWGVRDPDMSELEARHVWQPSLESALGTGHVQCLPLTRVKAEEPGMSGTKTKYVQKVLL